MTQSATAGCKQQYPIHGKSEPFTFRWGVPLLVRPIRFLGHCIKAWLPSFLFVIAKLYGYFHWIFAAPTNATARFMQAKLPLLKPKTSPNKPSDARKRKKSRVKPKKNRKSFADSEKCTTFAIANKQGTQQQRATSLKANWDMV